MRIQIALEAEQLAKVKRKAADLGTGVAEYIRRLIDRDLAVPQTQADISAVFGLGSSGGSAIAAEGKSGISEAIETDWTRRTQ